MQKTDQLDDADLKDCELTWLQTAVKVEDDHEEAAQTQGKNQPVHFWFSHAESWRRAGGRGAPGDRTDSGWKQSVVPSTLSPIIAWIQRADLCHVGSCRTSLNAQSEAEKSGIGSASEISGTFWLRKRGRLHRPAGPSEATGLGCGRRLGKFRRGVVQALLLFNSFLPKPKF